MKQLLFCLAIMVSFPGHSQQWVFQSGKQTNNGSVTVKSTTGSTQAATQNPTGAAAKVNQTAVTQAPLVVTQATATLPVVVEGTACNSATQQTGIKTDLSMLYGCQGSIWVRLNNVPTVTEGAGCGGYDKFGMTAGNAKQMACQGGVWKNSAGGVTTGGGKSQLWKALAGQTISCSGGAADKTATAYAYVDGNGTPYVRLIVSSVGDTGYLTTPNANMNISVQYFDNAPSNGRIEAGIDMAGLTVKGDYSQYYTGGVICSAAWN